MHNGSEQQILNMIRSRRAVRSRELIREVACLDPQKAILRLRRKGYPIENLSPTGKEGLYCWVDKREGKGIDGWENKGKK